MTSASNPATVLDTGRIDAVAERIATHWGHHGHSTLTVMIAESRRAGKSTDSTTQRSR